MNAAIDRPERTSAKSLRRRISIGILAMFLMICSFDAQSLAQDAAGDPVAKTDQTETSDDESVKESTGKTVVDEFLETYVGPDDKARLAFLAPPNAKPISKKGRLWVDPKQQRVYADGYVAMREGALEMFACPVGSKEHESVVAVLAKSREVHAGLLAIKAVSGTPVQFLPNFVPPTGQAIRVWVCWRDKDGKFHAADGRSWVLKNGTEDKQMQADWVFAGSGFWKDPADGREYYRADGGDMICVSNFTTAMLDVNISSSAQAGALQYIPFTKRIPKRYTPVRVVLVPIPIVSDGDDAKAKRAAANAAPKESVLPVNPNAHVDKEPVDSNSN